jgi:hypothetical protein
MCFGLFPLVISGGFREGWPEKLEGREESDIFLVVNQVPEGTSGFVDGN